MKKMRTVLLTLLLLLACAGCSGSTGNTDKEPATDGKADAATVSEAESTTADAAVNDKESTAVTMRLEKSEGAVTVLDDGGKDQEPREKLPLFSGYGIETQGASFSWFNLDDVKLIKMDENSEVSIEKEDKHLKLLVDKGRLYFNITEPLADDETLEISTSTMTVGIRGTCGWVDADENAVYILEGVVICSSDIMELDVPIEPFMVARCEMDGTIWPDGFEPAQIPEFVWEEMDEQLFNELGLSPNREDLFAEPDESEAEPETTVPETTAQQTAYGSGTVRITGERPSDYDESFTCTVEFTYVDGVMTSAEYNLDDGKGAWGSGWPNAIEDQPYYGRTVEELVETWENQGYTMTIR